MEEIAREFGINSYSTVITIIEKTRNEVVKKRRLKRRIEQLMHELEMSQEQTPESIESRITGQYTMTGIPLVPHSGN